MAKSPVPVHPLIVVFVLLSLLVPTAIRQGNNLSIWLLGTMIIATILTFVWTRLTIRSIAIGRVHTGQARVGQPFSVGYEVQNTTRFQPAFSLWIQELDSKNTWSQQFRNATAWVMEVGPKEQVRTDTIFLAKKTRGCEVRSSSHKNIISLWLNSRIKSNSPTLASFCSPRITSASTRCFAINSFRWSNGSNKYASGKRWRRVLWDS